jgi:hypothetical protein
MEAGMTRTGTRIALTLSILLFALTCGPAVLAQTSAVGGDISGIVTDQTGAVLPGVSVTITSNETGVSHTFTSDARGAFLALNLQPGSYTVKADLSGFTTVTLTKVTLDLGQRVNVPVQMKVGTLSDKVTVSSESGTIVELAKTDVSTLINERAMTDFPINVRNPLQFILTAPGTTPQRTTTGSGYSFGGARARDNSSILDGVDNNDDSIRGFLSQPPLDSVKEFQVYASNYAAEFGRASGGVVNTILRSGSNRLSGSTFDYLRDRSVAANNFFTNAATTNPPGFKPYFRQQQPGGSIGGPIKRNALFFFTSYEHFRTDNYSNVTIKAPDAAIINDVLAGNYAAVNLGPNFPRGIKFGYSEVVGPGTFANDNRRHLFVEKVDWQASPNDAIYVRYLYNRQHTDGSGSGLNDSTRNGLAGLNWAHSLVANYAKTLSSRTLNEARFQISTFTTGGTLLDSIGPGINISGVGSFGRNLNQPQGRTQDRLEFIDNYSVHTDNHEMKFGADLNRVHIISSLPGTNAGPLGGLGGVFTFPSMAAFLDGNASNFLQGFGSSGTDNTQWNYGLFAQDQIKPTPKMTLSAGVRYELQINPSVANILDTTPREIHRNTKNFAPRLGFSYNPDGNGKMVVRAGYGIFHDFLYGNISGNAGQFNGLNVKTIVMVNADAAARFRGRNLGFAPGALPNVPPPAGYGNIVWVSPSPIPDSAFPLQTITTVDPNLPTPYSHQMHVTVERELGHDLSMSVAYLYNRHLDEAALRNLNLPPPIIDPSGRVLYNINNRPNELPDKRIFINNEFEGIGRSSYKALVVSAKQRFNRFMQFQASWTFSHAIDYIPDAIFDVPFAMDQNNLAADKGNSLQDQRHKFAFSGVFITPTGESALKRVFGDINVSPIVTVGTGVFYNITTGADSNGDSVSNDRPLGVGRNTFQGDGTKSIDLRISKGFPIGGTQLQLIADVFNILNFVAYTGYNTVWGTGSYPDNPRSTFGTPTGAADPRIIQFGVRYTF